MTVKNIYLTCEEGCEALMPFVEEGVREMLGILPKSENYEKHFPITNLGNWKDDGYISANNGQLRLEPYKSIKWYIERAKLSAKLDGRWQENGRKQINCKQLCDDLANDPYAQKIPQYSVLITKNDLYAPGLNFCNGITQEGNFVIVSAARFIDENNIVDIDRFQTVVMHEVGHLLGATPKGRKNSYEQLGTHCNNGDIMEQDMSGTAKKMTQNRLRRKQMGLPPICPDCATSMCKFLDREIYNHTVKNRLNISQRYNG